MGAGVGGTAAGLVIRPAVSEGFVVATRRTRTAGKVDIPSVDDPISKLEHMGKETVKKLADIQLAAVQAGIDLPRFPENCVTKVSICRCIVCWGACGGWVRSVTWSERVQLVTNRLCSVACMARQCCAID